MGLLGKITVVLIILHVNATSRTRVEVDSQGNIIAREQSLLAVSQSLRRAFELTDELPPAVLASIHLLSEISGFERVDGGIDRVCRGASADDNSASYYTVKDAPSINVCVALCALESECKGVEYHADGRCELWTRTGGILATRAGRGYTCLRRSARGGFETPVFLPVDGGTDRACRGADSADTSSSYYTVAKGVPVNVCRALCVMEASCHGIQHDGQRRCELWTRTGGIESSAVETGSSCYRYMTQQPELLSGSTQQPEAPPESPTAVLPADPDCKSPMWPACNGLSGKCCPHHDGLMLACCFEAKHVELPTPTPSHQFPASAETQPYAGLDNEVLVGWSSSGRKAGHGWCEADVPTSSWNLFTKCGGQTQVRVLTYNLFWWNLFGLRRGNHGSAGKHIVKNGPYDIIGFQECDDVGRVLGDAGLTSSFSHVGGRHALAIAFNHSRWQLLSSGVHDVAEDRHEQHYGRRACQWARFRHKDAGKIVFFVNHHGPLPVNTGGLCAGEATAYNILRAIGLNSYFTDVKLLVGDFNADEGSATQTTLSGRMHRATSHWVDAIYASCKSSESRNIGNGGSDHDALEATFRI